MALVVKINNIDKTAQINWRDFIIEQNITKDPDLCTFSLAYIAGGYKPVVNQSFVVELDSVKIFAGTIIEINDILNGGLVEKIECVAKDYTFDLDRKLVSTSYENKTADYIIKDIIDNFTTGFTYAGVVSGAGTVKKITFNYETPSKAIQKIADLFDWDWYVDYGKDLHFFESATETAPFSLTEAVADLENFIGNSLNIKQDLSQVRNIIYVRGGDQKYTLTSTNSEKTVADGSQNQFLIGHAFLADTDFKVEKSVDGGANWTNQIAGQYGIDDPASYDCLFDPNKKVVIFPEASKPASGDLIRIYGSYYLPVIVYRSNQNSISTYGEFEFRIIDESIKSKDEAGQKAKAELRKYAEKAHTGSFKTYKDGLEVGQWITITLTSLGITGSHKIQKLRIGVVNPSTPKFIYEATIVASEIVSSVDILSKLLISDVNKNITIEQNEVVDKVYGFEELISLAEVWLATVHPKATPDFTETCTINERIRINPWGVDVAPIWVAGGYYPVNDGDRKRVPRIDAKLYVQ